MSYLSTLSHEQLVVVVEKAREARTRKLALWASLSLRQTYEDEAHMRQVLSRNKIVAPTSIEPATTKRVRQLLRRVDIDAKEIKEAVGPHWEEKTVEATLDKWLKMNEHPVHGPLPLWAATAWLLELCGR